MTRMLSDMDVGGESVILALRGSGAVRRRLQDMGVIRGTAVRVLRRAPLGDPMEIAIKDYRLTLRREEASHILVEVS